MRLDVLAAAVLLAVVSAAPAAFLDECAFLLAIGAITFAVGLGLRYAGAGFCWVVRRAARR